MFNTSQAILWEKEPFVKFAFGDCLLLIKCCRSCFMLTNAFDAFPSNPAVETTNEVPTTMFNTDVLLWSVCSSVVVLKICLCLRRSLLRSWSLLGVDRIFTRSCLSFGQRGFYFKASQDNCRDTTTESLLDTCGFQWLFLWEERCQPENLTHGTNCCMRSMVNQLSLVCWSRFWLLCLCVKWVKIQKSLYYHNNL